MTPYQSAARNNDLSYVAQAMEVRSMTTLALEKHALAHETCVMDDRPYSLHLEAASELDTSLGCNLGPGRSYGDWKH